MSRLSLLRAGIAAGAVAGAALLGRKRIDKQIESKLSAATQEAIALAEAELDKSVNLFLKERLRNFGRTMAVKFLLLGLVVLAFFLGLLTTLGLKVFVLVLGLSYVAYDLREALPKAWPAFQYARSHGFNAKSMTTDFVAAIAFERAYEDVMGRLSDRSTSRWIALSSFDPHAMSTEIAEAVSEVARHASYDKIRPRAFLFTAFTVVLSVSYTALAFLVIHS